MDYQSALPLTFFRATRQERMEQAMAVIERGGAMPLSTVARLIGLKKTPYLRGIMCELRDLGLVSVESVDTGHGIPTMLYRPVYGPQGVGNEP